MPKILLIFDSLFEKVVVKCRGLSKARHPGRPRASQKFHWEEYRLAINCTKWLPRDFFSYTATIFLHSPCALRAALSLSHVCYLLCSTSLNVQGTI